MCVQYSPATCKLRKFHFLALSLHTYFNEHAILPPTYATASDCEPLHMSQSASSNPAWLYDEAEWVQSTKVESLKLYSPYSPVRLAVIGSVL